MKKILLSFVLSVPFIMFTQAQTWNISESPFGAAASYSTNTVVSNLTISPKVSTTDGAVTAIVIDANSKTIDGFSFTYRLKLGASGNTTETTPYLPSNGYVSFAVTGPMTITVYGMSSSSSAGTRTLAITDGTTLLGELSNDGTAIGGKTVSYTGTGGTIYLYSESSGFNIYYINASAPSSITSETADKGTVVSTTYYDITGRKVDDLATGLVLRKVTYEDGSSEVIKSFVKK